MPSSLPDIDFRRIRPFGQPTSRAGGFEELVCILLERFRDWPDGTRFERFGNPDGGREGRATLADGSVVAWQVKYLFRFNSAAAGQVEGSFRRTLDTEPELCCYMVVLPIDLPAGDTGKRMSAHTRWVNKVKEWKNIARKSGREIEFEFIGQHELLTALLKPSESGLIRYWFDQSFMDDDWFQERMNTAIAKAGPRYSPKLHTETKAALILYGGPCDWGVGLTLYPAGFLCLGRDLSADVLVTGVVPRLGGGCDLIEALAKVLHRECPVGLPASRVANREYNPRISWKETGCKT